MDKIPTMWAPPVIRWFINPMNTIVIGTINHSFYGVICTNLAIVWGPHFVWNSSFLTTLQEGSTYEIPETSHRLFFFYLRYIHRWFPGSRTSCHRWVGNSACLVTGRPERRFRCEFHTMGGMEGKIQQLGDFWWKLFWLIRKNRYSSWWKLFFIFFFDNECWVESGEKKEHLGVAWETSRGIHDALPRVDRCSLGDPKGPQLLRVKCEFPCGSSLGLGSTRCSFQGA